MKKFITIIKFPTLKRFIIVLFLLTLFVFVSAISYVSAVSNNIANSVFRLHVIANSDSKEDQNLKYIVRVIFNAQSGGWSRKSKCHQ